MLTNFWDVLRKLEFRNLDIFRQIERILALRTLHVNNVSRFFTEIGISEFGFFRQIEKSLALVNFNVNKVSRFFHIFSGLSKL